MKPLLLLSTLAAVALAAPNGYFYQQSSSKSSSSSYKNNELQHQAEDESYYSRHGDSEGRTQPKVNTYSQHLQYQNPHNQNNGHSTNFGSQSQSTVGHGDDSDAYAARQAVGSDGIVRTVSGNRDQYTYTATYGVSGGESTPLRGGQYDTQSSLLSLTQTVQNDLATKLDSAITQQRSSDAHSGSSYVETNFRNLENELKANLSRQLQAELQRHYGMQRNKGSHSYTVQNGQYSPQANYNTQELQDLTSQLESNLMQQLRNQYRNTQSSSSSNSNSNYYSSSASSSQQTEQGSRAHTSMYRPTYESFPLHPEVRPSVPLTDVLSQVQNTVDRRLNDALSRTEQQYLTHNTHSEVPNYDVILQNLKEELQQNITSILQTTLVERYGAQEEHNNYYYSSRNVVSGSKVANYNIDDLTSLKQQVENNLTQKLKTSIQQQRQNYQTTSQSYSHSQSYSSKYNSGNSNPVNGNSNTPEIYTSYVVFAPSRRPDSVYSQTNTHNSENTYGSLNEQTNVRPEYRPSHTPTDTQRPSYTSVDTQRPSYTPTDTQRPSYTPTDTQRPSYSSIDVQRPSYTPTDTQRPSYTPTDTQRLSNGPTDTQRQLIYTRPDYQGSSYTPTDTQGPQRLGILQPSSSQTTNHATNTYRTNSGNQDAQRVELEYDYSPTGSHSPSGTGPTQVSQAPIRGTYYPSNSGSSIIPSGGAQYPSHTQGAVYPTSNTRYPSNSGTSYPSGGGGSNNYQTNYQTSQQNSESSHKIVAGQRQSGIEYTSGVNGAQQPEYQAELINIRDQVQDDLTRQVNTALEKQRQTSSSYSSSSVANSQTLSTLSEELKRNLTQKIEKALNEHYGRTGVRGGYTYTLSTGGRINPSNYNQEQLTTLTNQLQEDLLRQLREGLAQQSYRQSSSYSSNYEPVISQGTYGQSGTNSYRTYSSGSSYSYGSNGGQGECCMQADDATTTAEEDMNQLPERGDINIASKTERKLASGNSESDVTKPKTDDIQTQDQFIDIEVPAEDTEVTTQKLARDKPSTKKPLTVEPKRQDEKPQQRIPTNHAASATQDLINFERHQNENDHRQDVYQQRNQNSDVYDQQIVGQSHFDQGTIDEYDQLIGGQQETDDQLTEQHATGNTQQTGTLLQSTIRDLTTNDNVQANSGFRRYSNTPQTNIQNQHSEQELTQQTEDLTQQTEDLTQQTDDLTQQTEDLNHQIQDLSQQTEDLNKPQTVDLNQQTEDLNQETEDQNQHTQNWNQQSEKLNEQSADLSQQVVELNQQTQKLNQQTEDIDYSDQIIENLHQQQSEDLDQHFEQQNIDQYQSRLSHQQRNIPHVYLEHQTSAESERYASEHGQHMSQQIQDMDQNGEILHHHSQSAYASHNSQSSSSHSSSASRQVHYGSVNHVPLLTTSSLEQQHLDLQNANVVQDVSHQVIVPSSSSFTSKADDQKLEDTAEITTEKPGFWKKLGGKISHTYHKAKDSITSIG